MSATAPTARRLRARWAVGRLPWSAGVWRDTAFVVAGVPLHAAGVVATLAPLLLGLTAAPLSVSLTVMLLATVVFGAVVAVLLVTCVPLLTRLQRSRLAALSSVRLPRQPEGAPRLTHWRAVVATLRSEALWRQVGYHVLAGPAAALGALLTLGLWACGAALALLPCYGLLLPSASALSLRTQPESAAVAWVLGIALLFAAPLVAGVVARVDARWARRLLGPNRARELQRRVDHLAVSRAAVLAAADTERRRIERDLHDGTQQRLVAMAMKIGIARATNPGFPPEVQRLLAEVHGEAKLALSELRDLVRGLHPAVLDEQGLDAALSGIAARAPFPVKLHVSAEAEGRAEPAIEAVAYFVVSEALANIAKHAEASRADIHLERAADILRVTVIDDGRGGADPARGSGLTGLTQRVSSVDGTFRISSPLGGPTRITVELPCEL
ncbi:signal transduction histidine kinase [Kitasatospora sp. MAP12-15]|uniref:sensor histidine kinase n=1 Tax=unclassified Kitasatospora TaxID=2633591 RepID=UPI0024738760|nr:sensor histidine kinase [Kitasatospora sp. MAP12-44]MDH6113772.1 signal transduction histidine kinase [Kitasatospora sp. MAP12-44]